MIWCIICICIISFNSWQAITLALFRGQLAEDLVIAGIIDQFPGGMPGGEDLQRTERTLGCPDQDVLPIR